MSRQDHDATIRPRQRSNTASFTALPWRRGKPDSQPPTPQTPSPTASLSPEALIEALSPPAVPSLTHARTLAGILPTLSPLPKREVLNPLLAALCDSKSPPSIQAAGYDVLAAYWENPEAPPLCTAERLTFISLFLGRHGEGEGAWNVETWEPKFKALRSLTRYGRDIVGVEDRLVEIMKGWIGGAFRAFIDSKPLERGERTERERCVDVLVKFFNEMLHQPENTPRFTTEVMASVLSFYGQLVDDALMCPMSVPLPPAVALVSPPPRATHRRNASSLSSTSNPSGPSQGLSSYTTNPVKHPAEIAVEVFLADLPSHIKALPPTYLRQILPLLFRALGFWANPLPRLSVHQQNRRRGSLEDKLTDTLNPLFAGPYATLCMRILKFFLYPPNTAPAGLWKGPFGTWSPPKIHPTLAILTSLGAHRTLRNYVRRALSARLARAYILREASTAYSYSGIPVNFELESELMEKAWPKEDHSAGSLGLGGNGWDAGRLGKVLAESVGAWIAHQFNHADDPEILQLSPEKHEQAIRKATEGDRERVDDLLEEAAGVLKDILQELDLRDDETAQMDEEEASVVGSTLFNLSGYLFPLRNSDGTRFIVPINQPNDAPTPILRTIATLLARDHIRPLNPLLSTILIHVAEHLTDTDTSRIPYVMAEQHDLSPTSPDWLSNWECLFGHPALLNPDRPYTRRAVMEVLQNTYESVKDMVSYRRPLSKIIWAFCTKSAAPASKCQDADVMWKMIGEETVLRNTEAEEDDSTAQEGVDELLNLLSSVSKETQAEEVSDDAASTQTPDAHSPIVVSTPTSPNMSRTQSTAYGISREGRDAVTPSVSVMSIFASLAGSSSRSQSVQPTPLGEVPPEPLPVNRPDLPSTPREASCVAALIEVFSQLVFTPLSLEEKNVKLAHRVFDILLQVAQQAVNPKARLTAFQFLVRLRVDRDHRLYFVSGTAYDPNDFARFLASLVDRVPELRKPSDRPPETDDHFPRTRGRNQPDWDNRQPQRGRRLGEQTNNTASRSRSRTAAPPPIPVPPPPLPKPVTPLWQIPETLPFCVSGADSPSEAFVSYDPEGINHSVLPISRYLQTVISVLETETSWEVVTYVLCHIPVQLANKHLFCGPKCREAISKICTLICNGLLNSSLVAQIDRIPPGLKLRDAQSVACHTLAVLVSYRRCLEVSQRHLMVEVFVAGLNGQLATIKCCLHALSLAAFELPTSITKCLSRILEKLSQIMSNPNMAVHILGFLAVIGSLRPLHVNFTEGDFKMVFGVALQYLQHYNREHSSPTMSWALSQHVRILSYSVVYAWFLAIKLPDRPKHVQYIVRQLLLANEGNSQVDDPTEVCFDWLARYTYASADPRPAHSLFSDVVLNSSKAASGPSSEKAWVMGNSVMTVRALERTGWVEVLIRRPSGFSKFACHVENVPLIGPGDVDPDFMSVAAGMILERNPPEVSVNVVDGESVPTGKNFEPVTSELLAVDPEEENIPRPDPITGYVWSGTAPSQRRKEVSIDPSFLVLQLSPTDGSTMPLVRRIHDQSRLQRFLGLLDRIPVIDTHKVGILYVAPGQTSEVDILRNTHGSPAYTRFLEGLGRLIYLRGQVDVYAGGLDPEEDGDYAYAWWDDIGQILYHTATLMPNNQNDPNSNWKKRHIGNDYVRIVWNDSGQPYRFDTLTTQFQFVNIVIEPHSVGSISAFSNNIHENEYFKLTLQLAPGMTEFAPVGNLKLISAENLPLLVRQLSILSDRFAKVFADTQGDTVRTPIKTNWHERLESIRRFKSQLPEDVVHVDKRDGVIGQEALRDFTTSF